MRCVFLLTTFVAGLSLAAPAFAQNPTLAELAKKEEARRKAVQAPAKVVTNDDVKKGTPPPVGGSVKPATGESGDASHAKDTSDPKDKAAAARPDDQVKDEAYWKERMTQAREELRRSQMFAEALQTRVNALTADFTARDDPQQRARVAEDRVKALAELDRLKADMDAQKKKIDEIEEDARRAGVPAGWLR